MTYNFNSVKILLVEDNRQMLDLLKAVLQSFGVGEIITALDGIEAYEKFRRTNPDLVLTDWMMDPCDGIQLGHKIRNESDSPNQFVPIILMTGFSEERRVLSARDNGITEFLVKPFNARDLYKRLYQIIEKPRQFVKNESFFGPDRRRKSSENYDGNRKRKSDNLKDALKKDAPVSDIDFR
ncbi:MAG: response regulator [Alphaproteobacteria bacterium]|nr:response regulator [Alphaproteobacteria bacterium]